MEQSCSAVLRGHVKRICSRICCQEMRNLLPELAASRIAAGNPFRDKTRMKRPLYSPRQQNGHAFPWHGRTSGQHCYRDLSPLLACFFQQNKAHINVSGKFHCHTFGLCSIHDTICRAAFRQQNRVSHGQYRGVSSACLHRTSSQICKGFGGQSAFHCPLRGQHGLPPVSWNAVPEVPFPDLQ